MAVPASFALHGSLSHHCSLCQQEEPAPVEEVTDKETAAKKAAALKEKDAGNEVGLQRL